MAAVSFRIEFARPAPQQGYADRDGDSAMCAISHCQTKRAPEAGARMSRQRRHILSC